MTDFKNGTAELSNDLMFLFNRGENYKSYNIFGAHVVKDGETQGCSFSVWAPSAKSVSVVCDRNGWDRSKNPMEKYPDTGIWKCFACDNRNSREVGSVVLLANSNCETTIGEQRVIEHVEQNRIVFQHLHDGQKRRCITKLRLKKQRGHAVAM